MTLKWNLLVFLQYELIMVTQQSIAGVTYMDHFDFEERYRDVHECDPFHWHPLHLPEHCAEMFEQLIRSRIAADAPVRIAKKKDQDNIYKLDTNYGYPYFSFPTYETELIDIPHSFNYRTLSSYEKMLESMRKDVMKQPTAPVMAVMPNFGQVAVYRQPISKISENLIKKIATAYANADRQDFDSYYGKIEIKNEPPVNESVEKKLAKYQNKNHDNDLSKDKSIAQKEIRNKIVTILNNKDNARKKVDPMHVF